MVKSSPSPKIHPSAQYVLGVEVQVEFSTHCSVSRLAVPRKAAAPNAISEAVSPAALASAAAARIALRKR